jgi:hypothetical protein
MNTILNKSAVKRYALTVSEARRAGKFKRVGTSFFQRCESRMEATLKAMYRGDCGPETPTAPVEELVFSTAFARAKAREQMEALAKDIIFNEVRSHPSLGQTLK